MELMYWYTVLAALVALMSVIDLYHPVMQKHKMSLDIRILHYVVWYIISLVIAPLLIYPCFRSLAGVEFRDALDKALFG